MNRSSGSTATLTVLVAVNILNFYDRHVIGALTEPIRKEFGLSDGQVGLMGSAFIWLYALVGLPLGRVADAWSRKKLLASGMLVWSVLTAMAAVASSYTMLLFSRLGFAVGEAVVAPAATSWIGDLFPAVQRSRPLALFMLGVPVGGALSYFFSGPVAQAYGWRIAMVLAAVPAVVLIPVLLRMAEPARGAAELHREALAKPAANSYARAILSIPTMWWIIASGALLNFNMYAIATFLPAFLSRIHGLTLARSGIATGVVFAVGGVAGGLLAGRWGDRVIHRRKNGRLLLAAAIAAIGAPAGYLGIGAGGAFEAVALIAVAYGTLNAYYGLVYSAIQDIVAPAMRGTSMAIYFMAMYLCGASFGPLLTGRLSDLMARRAADAAGALRVTEAFKAIGLQQAMFIIPILSLLLALVLYCGSKTIVADMRKRESVATSSAYAD
ncbi:MAG TPA: MFS transporter [Candidatus Acidoferrales bacterium]|jgi:MFS family permease|nr:MFS transporter [Candidatus Acidoferrales bacterium]